MEAKDLVQQDYFLDKFKVQENNEKIVFEIPVGVHIDLLENRDFLLKQFKNVEVTIQYPRTRTQIVTCFKHALTNTELTINL